MDAIKQLKEVSLSVLPIALISSVLALVLGVVDVTGLLWFLFSCVVVIIGLTLFLLGVNIGLLPIGNKIGSAITKSRSLLVIILVSLLLGFVITVAEPDVQVLAGHVTEVNPLLNTQVLVYAIGIGVAIFLTISLLRTILHLPLKVVIFISYLLVFALAAFIDEFFVSVAFDSGGATTGPMSVPFIMALGMGVASSRKKDEEGEFGYVALSSVGPICAVLVLGLIYGTSSSTAVAASEASNHAFWALLGSKFSSVGMSLSPLLIVCVIAQFGFLHLPKHQTIKIAMGILYSYIGLVLFSFGVDFTFSSIANDLGAALASYSPISLVLCGALFGACVVLAEPAIWVLTEQVEEVSVGHIRRRVMLIALSLGVSVAVVLGLLRTIFNLSIWYFLLPGYAIILLVMWKTPKLFSAIAFDSGGVATGPMSSTFLLPYAIGAASVSSSNGNAASFGLIALIAMMPIICISVLGLIYDVRLKREERRKQI